MAEATAQRLLLWIMLALASGGAASRVPCRAQSGPPWEAAAAPTPLAATDTGQVHTRTVAHAGPARVVAVQVIGAHSVSADQVKQWLGGGSVWVWSDQELQRRSRDVLERYRREGYPWARVDSVGARYTADSSGVEVSFWLEEGPEVRTGELVCVGIEESWRERLLGRFDTRPGRPFSDEVLRQDLQDALSDFENWGYPFARVVLDSLHTRPAEGAQVLDVHLSFYPGPQVRVDEVRVRGALTTRTEVIARAAGLRPGQVYSQRLMERVPLRLRRLGFIESVEPPMPFVSEHGRGGVLLTVREGKASAIDGVLGYNPGTGGQKGYLTGLLDLSLGNLFGTARALQARWQKRDQKTQELRFAYREPWLLGTPLGAGVSFEQLVQDTTYVRRDLAVELSLPVAEWLGAKMQLGRSEVLPDSLATALMGMPRSRTLSLAVGLDYDTRDEQMNPRSGVRYQTALFLERKRHQASSAQLLAYGLKQRLDNRRVVVDAEFYLQLFRYQVLALALHGRQVTSTQDHIALEDQFRFSGARTLRGYREYQFRGSKVAWVNLEYRYLLGRRSRAFVFVDGGYFWRQDQPHSANEGYRLGYGCGVRLETGLGIVGVDLGLGKGDSLLEAKLHVGLVNEF